MFETIDEDYTFELVEKKSRFIANLMYVDNREDAETKIKELKKKYHDARHNCFAYRVLEDETIFERSSDDGEPSGTAGAPMLNILQRNNFCNVLVVVTRYFGGILLGTGGLVRAYSGAVQGVIQNATKIQIEQGCKYKVLVDYNNFQNFQYYCKKTEIRITKASYGETVECVLEMNTSTQEKFLQDLKNKKIIISIAQEKQNEYIRT